MRHFEKVKIPAQTKEKLTHVTCDICKEEIKKESYSATETEVKMRKGDMYPEGGWGEEIEYDICPKCFTDKLIPWLEENGAKREWDDWDY